MTTKEDIILDELKGLRKDFSELRKELWGLKPKLYVCYVLVGALAAKVFGVKFI